MCVLCQVLLYYLVYLLGGIGTRRQKRVILLALHYFNPRTCRRWRGGGLNAPLFQVFRIYTNVKRGGSPPTLHYPTLHYVSSRRYQVIYPTVRSSSYSLRCLVMVGRKRINFTICRTCVGFLVSQRMRMYYMLVY